MKICKPLFKSFLFLTCIAVLGACSTNPATGNRQFAGLMSPRQEVQVGASEHRKIQAQFGFYEDAALQAYVNEIGQRVTQQTERPDVTYKFFVLDSPIINAFALPGGYIYVSRGLLALANDEAELAAVLSHETGHITARHSAERYSHGVLTSLGAAAISAAVDSTAFTQALGVGSDLYLSSYSRTQEDEADSLGLRYMTRGGYDPAAMSAFLASLQRDTALESQIDGKAENFSYFSTHPATADRVSKTLEESRQYAQGGNRGRDVYLSRIDNMVYGDSIEQGFVRGQTFYHPDMGFGFTAPDGFKIINQPDKVVAVAPSGAVIIFDIAGGVSATPAGYLTHEWLKKDNVSPQAVTINNMAAATAGFEGSVNGQAMNVQLLAIQWQGKFARFQVAMPKNASSAQIDALKRATYSFHSLSASEKTDLKPQRLRTVIAGPGDTVASLAARQPFSDYNEQRFRVLNALTGALTVQPGQKYKIVIE